MINLSKLAIQYLSRQGFRVVPEHGFTILPDIELKEREMPDPHVYNRYISGAPIWHGWQLDGDIAGVVKTIIDAGSHSLVSWDRMWTLKWAFLQTRGIPGEIWEAGVYRGGTALLLRMLIDKLHHGGPPTLRLFDSFEGLPTVTENVDSHKAGDFNDTSLAAVKLLVGEDSFIEYHPGWVPDTFRGVPPGPVRFAHIDLDLYQPMLDASSEVYPRLVPGAVIVFDDYGMHSCYGARKAIDEFFYDKPEVPFALPTGQAIVVKLP